MGIRSAAVGIKSEPLRLEVTTRMVQAYAAGVADRNPRYFDDADAAGIVAPPAFCVSVQWPVYRKLAGATELGASRAESLRAVHALQDSTFWRPIRPGDVLFTRATVVEIRATRAGAYVLTRLDSTHERGGASIVTSYSGILYRGVAVDGVDTHIERPPPFAEGGSTSSRERVEIPVSPEAAHVYTECAQIWNPIHTERRVAFRAGLPNIVLHGTATWALAAREIVSRFAGSDPSRLRRFAGEFRAPVIPGSIIVLEVKREGGRVDFEVRNEDGSAAIAHGCAALENLP